MECQNDRGSQNHNQELFQLILLELIKLKEIQCEIQKRKVFGKINTRICNLKWNKTNKQFKITKNKLK